MKKLACELQNAVVQLQNRLMNPLFHECVFFILLNMLCVVYSVSCDFL